MVRHVLGAVCFAAAAYLIWSALGRRRLAREQAAAGITPPPLHPSLSLMADFGPPLIIFGLVVAGGQTVVAFLLTDGGGVFSRFDLAGFVALLVAYGVWVKVKGRYRVAT